MVTTDLYELQHKKKIKTKQSAYAKAKAQISFPVYHICS